MMPRWRQRYHLFAACFMCLLFTGISIIAAISVFGGARVQDGGTARIIATVVFGILAILGAVAQFWTRRRIVKEFSYDGHELRFRTLAGSEEQIWLLPEIASVREPRGRAP